MAQIQFTLKQHNTIRENMTGRICGVEVPLLTPMVQWLKRYYYTTAHVKNVGLLKTRRSRETIKIYKNIASVLSILLLLFFTFYIFLYVVRLNDNRISIAVLYGLLFAESVEVFFVGPVVALIFSAIIPAIIACVIFPEVLRVFRSDARRRMSIDIQVTKRASTLDVNAVKMAPPTGDDERLGTPI